MKMRSALLHRMKAPMVSAANTAAGAVIPLSYILIEKYLINTMLPFHCIQDEEDDENEDDDEEKFFSAEEGEENVGTDSFVRSENSTGRAGGHLDLDRDSSSGSDRNRKKKSKVSKVRLLYERVIVRVELLDAVAGC